MDWLVSFYVTFCTLMLITVLSALPFQEYGVVVSTNGTFKFVNDSLELYCNITDITLRENSSMLYFERSTKNGKTRILTEYVEILTTKAIRLRIEHLSFDGDDGVYVCLQDTLSGTNAPRLIDSTIIKIDNKPKSVENISCRVYNWETMNCTWNLGVYFRYPEYIDVSLAWAIQLPKDSRSYGPQSDCPVLTNTSCLWPFDKFMLGHMYFMRLEVKTIVEGREIMTERSPQFKIETQLYVEPAPVDNFNASVQNSSCVELSWKYRKRHQPKYYVAEYKPVNEEMWNPIILNQDVNNRSNNKKYNNDVVCSLTPFTSYEFRISVLPFPVETRDPVTQGHRSEWRNVKARTFEDVPAAAPKICRGCFHESKCSHNTSNRCIQIYWQDLKEQEKNGIIKNYSITYTNIETGDTENSFLSVTEPDRLMSAKLIVHPNYSYNITVTPSTSKGYSRSSSYLYLPSTQEKPNLPSSFLVEIDKEKCDDNPTYFLSWAAHDSSANPRLKYKRFSVMWCFKRGYGADCKDNNIQWIELPANQLTYELKPALEGQPCSDLRIGITADNLYEDQILSSGIYWSKCLHSHNQRPQKPPKNVRPSSKDPSSELTILWDKYDCSEETSFITGYLIKHCPISHEENKCAEDEKSKNVTNDASETILEHLKNGVQYKVTVIPISAAGFGPSSEILVNATLPYEVSGDSSTLGIAIGTSCGIILVVIIFIIIIAYCFRYCKSRREKVPKTDDMINHYAEACGFNALNKPQDIRNRPLPKIPEKQHYYESSACVNNYASDEIKHSQNSESSSEDSVTSQTNLLSKNAQNSSRQTNERTNKLEGTKYARKKASKQKGSYVKETELLLKNSSLMDKERSPSSFNGSKDPSTSSTTENNYSTIALQDRNNSNSVIPKSKLVDLSCKPNSSDASRSSGENDSLDEYHHVALDKSIPVKKPDSSAVFLCNENTLPLRNVQISKYPTVETELQSKDSIAPNAMRNVQAILDSDVKQPQPKYIPDNPDYIQHSKESSQPLNPNSSSKLSLLLENLDSSFESENDLNVPVPYLQITQMQSNQQPGYSKLVASSYNQDDSIPQESVSQFSPQFVLIPQCLEDTKLDSSPSLLHHNQISQSFSESQLFFDNKYTPGSVPTSINSHCMPLESFARALPCSNQSVLSNSHSCTSLKEGHDQHLCDCTNVDTIYVDNVSQVFDPRNHPHQRLSSINSDFLNQPRLLTRPLSGDLLDLPEKYYEDPKLGDEGQLLTEL